MTYDEAWEYLKSKGINTMEEFREAQSKKENQINIGMFINPLPDKGTKVS